VPIGVPSALSTFGKLSQRGLDVWQGQASKDAIQVAVLNLMPGKKATEAQLVGLLDNANKPIQLSFFRSNKPEADETRHEDWADREHLSCYRPISEAWSRKFDALIITGAPVGQKSFEAVTFWDELRRTYDWAKDNVGTTLNICWAAAAALKHFHGVERTLEEKKLFGVYPQQIWSPGDPLVAGLENGFLTPVSRYSIVRPSQVENVAGVEIVANNAVTGVGLVRDRTNRQILAFNHLEYSRGTLAREYIRDCEKGMNPDLPFNYFPGDNPQIKPFETWAEARRIFAGNWVNEASVGKPVAKTGNYFSSRPIQAAL